MSRVLTMILLCLFIGLKIYQSTSEPSSWSTQAQIVTAHLSGTTNPFTVNPKFLQEIGLALARRVWSYNKSSRGFPAVRFSTPVSVMLSKKNGQAEVSFGEKIPVVDTAYRSVSSNCALLAPSLVTQVQLSGQCSSSHEDPRLII